MDYTSLGNTDLTVSVAGLGMGGNSRAGRNTGRTEAESIAVIHKAIDLGVTLFDTASAYGTEELLGKALKSQDRTALVVSSKATIWKGMEPKGGADILEDIENTLVALQTDVIDLYQLHAVPPARYDQVLTDILPVLQQAQRDGKIRYLGITETAPKDPGHEMLQHAVGDKVWNVVMLAFHMMHQNARQTIFPTTVKNGVGTLLMFVLRDLFSRPDFLRETIATLVANGEIPAHLGESGTPLDFLVHNSGATSITDAAYRFARHEQGADVVLFGTGNADHLEENISSITAPPLPAKDVQVLYNLFGRLEGVGLRHSDTPGGGGRPHA